MKELWLKYRDENGEECRKAVEREKFTIGRHSENDLSIADAAISRRHLKIERFADVFVISDVGSSLGTTINGEKLIDPVALGDGDKLMLGDQFELEVEMLSDARNGAGDPEKENAGDDREANDGPTEKSSTAASATAGGVASSNASKSSIPTVVFITAPLLGVIVLLAIGGIFLATGGKRNADEQSASADDFVYSDERPMPAETSSEETLTAKQEEATPEAVLADTSAETARDQHVPPANSENSVSQTPQISREMAVIELNSAKFLRNIAQSDPRAFLSGRQQEIVKTKIDQIKNSPAVADNLRSAKTNAAQIRSLAAEKNLKPQFLLTAALARLGTNRGDVGQTARSIAEILDELSRNIGDERSDDALLVIAAFDQGAAGETLKMRNMLQGLVDKSPSSARQIRTIWFLKDNNHISEAQFDLAVRFLAIGTIAQNPSAFGVNAEAVSFE